MDAAARGERPTSPLARPRDVSASERTPLLDGEHEPARPTSAEDAAPLDKLQILTICALRTTGPLMFYSLFAYVNDMLIENGVATPSNLGFMSGLLEGCFCLSQIIATPFWGFVSDRIGRRPVLIYPGYFAAACLAAFGCSRSFAALLAFRMAMGMGNGVEAVVKTALVESMVESNQAVAFVWSSIAWETASVLSPVIGGTLSKPARWKLFDLPFFRHHPYALPALVSAVISVIIKLTAQVVLKETKPKDAVDKPRTRLRDIMGRKLILALAAWTTLMMVVGTRTAIFVLLCATPVENRGLGLSPAQIGSVLAINSVCTIVFTPIFGPYAVKRLGKKRMLQTVLPFYAIFFAAMPFVQRATAVWGTPALVAGLMVMLMIDLVSHLAFLASDLIVSNACPDRSQLVAFNSLQQVGSSFGILLSNWTMSSTFAYFSGAWPAYCVFVAVVLAALVLCSQLEEGGGWREREAEE